MNANVAEARRATRFSALGHTPAPVAPVTRLAAPEFPLTLDLRHG